MTDRIIIPLAGIGTLELTREQYEAALRPIEPPRSSCDGQESPTAELVTAKGLASKLSLPVSCVYEYGRTGRIPSVRAGKHVRFNVGAVLAALSAGGVTVGHS